ncbi:MAG: hypothetical protein QXD77_03275 [Candidatus Aenigmatarchaeota archaeon]
MRKLIVRDYMPVRIKDPSTREVKVMLVGRHQLRNEIRKVVNEALIEQQDTLRRLDGLLMHMLELRREGKL